MKITSITPMEALERSTVAVTKATENLARIRCDSVVHLLSEPTSAGVAQSFHNVAPEKRLMHMELLADPAARSHILITAKRSPQSIVDLVHRFACEDSKSPTNEWPFSSAAQTEGPKTAERAATTVSTDGAGVYHFEVRNGAERVWGRVIHDDGQLTTDESQRGPRSAARGLLEPAPSTYGRHHLVGGAYEKHDFAARSEKMQKKRDAQIRTVIELAATAAPKERADAEMKNPWFGGESNLKERLVHMLLTHSDFNDPHYLIALRGHDAQHVTHPTIRYQDCFTEAAGAEALARERAQTYLRVEPTNSESPAGGDQAQR